MDTDKTQIKASETPMTDAASLASCGGKLICVHADFARKLERELADSETARRAAVEFARTLERELGVSKQAESEAVDWLENFTHDLAKILGCESSMAMIVDEVGRLNETI